jgi:hypothetical protein
MSRLRKRGTLPLLHLYMNMHDVQKAASANTGFVLHVAIFISTLKKSVV